MTKIGPKILIFEGIDGTGKSNMIDLVVTEYQKRGTAVSVERLVDNPHELKPMESVLQAVQEVARWLQLDRLNQTDGVIIYDRFPYPSEYVYGDNGDMISADLLMWDKLLQQFDVTFIYSKPDSLEEYVTAKSINPDQHFATHITSVLSNLLTRYQYWQAMSRIPSVLLKHSEHQEQWFTANDAVSLLMSVDMIDALNKAAAAAEKRGTR